MSEIRRGKRVPLARAVAGTTYAITFPAGRDTYTFVGEYVSHEVRPSTSANPPVELTLKSLSPGALEELKKRELEIVKEEGDTVTFVPPKFFEVAETMSNAAPGGRRRKTRRRRGASRRRR